MKKTVASKAFAVMLVTIMCITLFSFGSSAVSLDKRGSITIKVYDIESKEAVNDAVFRVYRFASAYAVSDGIGYIYTDEFKGNGMDMGDFSDAYLPVHLMNYAYENTLPYIEKLSDSNGKVVFDNLTCGAYLVVPAGIEEGYLNPSPFIVAVPTKIGDSWIYNIDASPKVECEKDDTQEKTYISAKKYWQSADKTPDSVTVSLIKDGVIVDSVILSAGNNWYHKWENLDKNHSWSVVEKDVPEGYTVSYVTSQMTVIITNSDDDYDDETTTKPDETTTTDSTTKPDDTTTTDGTTKPDDTTTTDGTTGSDDTTTSVITTNPDDTTKPVGTTKPTGTTVSTTKPEELIDTGQLNWPVPVFAVAGMILFSIGWAMFNFGKKDEDAA